MRVFGDLSFYIFIFTCSTLFVNKQVQASDGQDTNSKVQDQAVVTESKAGVHRIGTTPINEVDTSVEEDTTNEEAEEFFDCLVRPRPPRITKIDFVQILNHFDHFDDRTWIQRAYLDSQYDKDDGPVLLKVGQDKEIFPQELEELSMVLLAKRYNAPMYILEHRYHGASVPTEAYLDSQYERDDGPVLLQLGSLEEIFSHTLEDPSIVLLAKSYHSPLYILEHRYHGASVPTDLSANNLELYFRSEQMLADIDFFIKKSKHNTRKWVVFGEGYGGTLAAWFRLKYPHAAVGALAVLAPIFSITGIPGNNEVFKEYKSSEREVIQEAFNEIHNSITRSEYNDLKEKFNMCTQLNEGSNINDNVNLMNWSILNYLSVSIIFKNEKVKKLLIETEKSPLDRLASVVKQFNEKQCFLVNFDDAINKYTNVNIKYKSDIDYPEVLMTGLGTLPTFYLKCTEYGSFETSNGQLTFGVKIDLDFYIKLCQKAFERNFDSDIYSKAMDTENMIYGGHDIGATNLIYFTPFESTWHSVGINKSPFNQIIVVNDEVKVNEHLMKFQYDAIVKDLNKWTAKQSKRTAKKSEAGDNSVVDATETV